MMESKQLEKAKAVVGVKDDARQKTAFRWRWLLRIATFPVWLAFWPLSKCVKAVDRNFLSYLTGRILRDKDRIYSIKFVWYNDSVYLHPMIWGSMLFYLVAQTAVVPMGWLLLLWFIGLFVCYLTIMYNFDVLKSAVLGTAIVAMMGLAYFATVEFSWNPLTAVASHVSRANAAVTPGFYLIAAYLFGMLIGFELVWAWLFHRVEIDESYVYEHQFLRGTAREPIFAQGLKRETKDLLELLLLGAGDIQHRTKKGFKRFGNVPFASLWLGSAIDSLLDYRRKGQVALERKRREDDDSDQSRIEDAIRDEAEDWDDDDPDDTDNQTSDDPSVDSDDFAGATAV